LKILFTIETLLLGGAELSLLRLANALKKRHEIVIYRIHRTKVDEMLLQKFGTGIKIKYPTKFSDFLLRKVDKIFYLLKLDFSIGHFFIKNEIKTLIVKERFDLIHSHLFKTDFVVSCALKGMKIPMVITIHGDYLNFSQRTKIDGLLNYKKKLNLILQRTNGIVCISNKQVDFFRPLLSTKSTIKLTKIYNGFENEKEIIPREKKPFVFGMIARGIPEKGWQMCIDAFLTLKYLNPKLILVGDSDYLTELKKIYIHNASIQFVGFTDEPIHWISKFHVGLLPTTYASESLPTSIIEYLYVGIPVIASDAGEISRMIQSQSGIAGTILPETSLNYQSLAKAMELYVTNSELYSAHATEALEAFKKFDMKKTIHQLESFYKQVNSVHEL
jgi:glycosyltransferase involved in cell wall biosynthesis